jgi:hypothetical protein
MSDSCNLPETLSNFEALAAARREWIENTLRVWCRTAAVKELRKAEAEWFDLAGRADPQATLWTWVWERFPDIVHPDLAGVNETHEVMVTLVDGRQLQGFPDNRASRRGVLILVAADENGGIRSSEPVEVDSIQAVQRVPLG